MKILVVLATCLVTTSPALALLDYSPNSLGCYFDSDGNVLCFHPTPAVPFNMYFILANPDVENLGGFEFGWRCEPEIVPAPFVLESVLPPGAMNSGDLENLIVQLDPGFPTVPATILLRLTLLVLAPIPGYTYVMVGPSTPTSIPGRATFHDFDHPDDIRPMNFSLWPDGEPEGWWYAARFSCPGPPISAESRTWGGVKTLFR